MDAQCPQAIFILGIMPRSGANFLTDLLALHPDCQALESGNIGGSTARRCWR